VGLTSTSNQGVALIGSQNVYDDSFSFSRLAFIDDDAAAPLAGVTVERGDILVSITGDSVARVNRAPAEVLPARVSQHVAIVRPDQGELDARFLHATLVAPATKARLLALASAGATRKALTKAMLATFELRIPDIREQRAIATVFDALDDKIESNRRAPTRPMPSGSPQSVMRSVMPPRSRP
jgi:type I restriction enzyme S subunit